MAGRSLGPWVTAFSERASGESAWLLLALPGAAIAIGLGEFWSVIGIILGIIWSEIISHFGASILIHRYYCHNQFKVPSWFEKIGVMPIASINPRV